MADIVLTTLNARYVHAAFGLRYLLANLGRLQERAHLVEFDINGRTLETVEALLALHPRIIGFGVYIWNVTQTAEIVSLLKKLRPEIIVILGGPEVSHETIGQPIVALADHVICGEADRKFAELCTRLLEPVPDAAPIPKILHAELPALADLVLPYELYTDADIAHRVLYVEASRGCPFTCEFCLSSLDVPVRAVALEPFLAAMERLLARGARQFKFVDRTFNLNLNTTRAILEFFLDRWTEGLFVHFEMVPDRLPEQIRELIARFPAGALQFEVGIQTFDEATAANISRRQNYTKLEDNFRYLRGHTGVHIHADLIVGLPGENIESFGRGFDRLLALRPQEIQVGILKRLRGTPIVRHDREWAMVYGDQPPYEILQNRLIDFPSMQTMRRFAKVWDMMGNSGRFPVTILLLWQDRPSPFWALMEFTAWLAQRLGRLHSVAAVALAESLYRYLTAERGVAREVVASALRHDWDEGIGRERLWFLEEGAQDGPRAAGQRALPKRQARHQR